ncbi:MAG: prepilin peptidase [Geminicoccaceae bacterium]
MDVATTALSIALLTAAAWRDLAVRTIPDRISLGLLAIGIVARASVGLSALLMSLAVAAALFGVLVLLHARGLMGGGDVKLASALAVGLTPLGTYHFVVATAAAGGLLGVAYLLMARRLRAPLPQPRMSLLLRLRAVEVRRIRLRRSLPYGVAIALGGIAILLLDIAQPPFAD